MQNCTNHTKLMDCKLFIAYLDENTDKTFAQRKRLPADVNITAKEWAANLHSSFNKNPVTTIGSSIETMMYRHNWSVDKAMASLCRHAKITNVINIHVRRTT